MSNRSSLAFVLLSVSLQAACGCTGDSGYTVPADGNQLEEYVASVFCPLRNACCNQYVGSLTDQQCHDRVINAIQQNWAGAFNKPREYNRAAAQRCVDFHMQVIRSCSAAVESIKALEICDQVFSASSAQLGESCETKPCDNLGEDWLRCLGSGSGVHCVVEGTLPLGANCGYGAVVTDTTLAFCDHSFGYCDPETQTCVAFEPVGTKIPDGALCPEGYWKAADSTCRPPSGVGGPCSDSKNCQTGLYCTLEKTCTQRKEAGVACAAMDYYECQEGLYCNPQLTCAPRRADGQSCDIRNTFECRNICVNGTCLPQMPDVCVNF